MPRNQNMWIARRIKPKQCIQHIRLVQTYTAAGCTSAAMQEYSAAAIRYGIRRGVVFDDDSIGVLDYIVLQMLYIAIAPAGFQRWIIPFLPGVEIEGIGIANPVGVRCHIPLLHPEALRLVRIAKGGTQTP